MTRTLSIRKTPLHDSPVIPSREEYIIPSDPAAAQSIQQRIEQLLTARQTHQQDLFGIKLALEEALINAIKHGNQMDCTKKVHVCFAVEFDRFEVQITDEGPGFDPNDVPDPTAIENLERPCGRGLMLMRHYMSQVTYTNTGNTVIMHKIFGNGTRK